MSVERSIGVAEHPPTGLTRRHVTRFLAVTCAGALGLLPAVPAHALPATDRIATTTQQIDAAAQRWFTAQADAQRIDAGIADVEHQIAIAQVSMEHTRKIATARAVVLYKNSDIGLTSMFGDNALDSARRAHLVDDANAGGDAAIAQLTVAVDDLDVQRRNLQTQRAEQQKILQVVASERSALDAQLASVRAVAQRQATVALEAARTEAARARADAHVRSFVAAHTADAFAPPTAPPVAQLAGPVGVTAPSGGSSSANNGRVSPHHDDPFLVCTRARESNGEYGVVSSSGYYGAYQFLPSTWDTTAVHAGRLDIVGVLPSRASPYDQDEMAWALYQWQGKGPWGGRC